MKRNPLKIQLEFILSFLIVEYLFGMFAAVFIRFPHTMDESVLWKFAQSQISVVLHMIIGALLVLSGIVFLIRTVRRRDKQLIIASSIGLVSLLLAGFAGGQFVSTRVGAYSYIMAVTFIVAFASYGWGLYKAKG